MSALFSIGFMDFSFSCVSFLLIPLVSLFYSLQISYSYVIHGQLHNFVYSNLEPQIAELVKLDTEDSDKNILWETYSENDSKRKKIKTIGILESFFKISTLVSSILGPVLFFLVLYFKSKKDLEADGTVINNMGIMCVNPRILC